MGASERVSHSEFYNEYKHFIEDNGNKPLSKNKLTSALEAMYVGIEKTRFKSGGKTVRGLTGVRLRCYNDSDDASADSRHEEDTGLTTEQVNRCFFSALPDELERIKLTKCTDDSATVTIDEKEYIESKKSSVNCVN